MKADKGEPPKFEELRRELKILSGKSLRSALVRSRRLKSEH